MQRNTYAEKNKLDINRLVREMIIEHATDQFWTEYFHAEKKLFSRSILS